MGLIFSYDDTVTGGGVPRQVSMEEARVSREEAARRLKASFLEALQQNNTEEVKRILHTTNIDIDTVFEVEDRDMVLASYKQGNICQSVLCAEVTLEAVDTFNITKLDCESALLHGRIIALHILCL